MFSPKIFHYYMLIIFGMISLKSEAILVRKLADLNTMAQGSDLVVHGHVGEQEVKYDERGRLVTLTKVEVLDGLYGAKTGQIISLYQVGGSKDGIVSPLIGGQHYELGQELIFFGLEAGQSFVSFGAGQGKLDVDPSLGSDAVREDLGDVVAIDPQDISGRSAYHPSPLTYSDVDILKNEIRQMLKYRH